MVATWCQVRFTTPSGAMVNTFNFNAPGVPTYQQHADICVAALTQFYNSNYGTYSLGGSMAGWVARNFEIRTYNPLDGKPRVPTIYALTLPSTNTTGTNWCIPADVAMCLSYHAAPPITRSKRGRVYIGGAQLAWFTVGSTVALPTFAVGANVAATIVKDAANALMLTTSGWSIYSRKFSGYFPIVGGYVDTEPDTQRRRGATTGARVSFGT